MTSIWDPGNPTPSADELTRAEQRCRGGASSTASTSFVSVYNFGSKTTPLTDDDQASFANYAAALARQVPDLQNFIIGNEPNLNRFWLPQFNPDGSDAAAPAYLSLLARTYTALKAVDPTITVFGGAISPRGIDRPGTGRDTHSPTVFIQDLGAAYRASGLTDAGDGRARHPPVPGQLEHPADARAPEHDADRDRRLPEARRAARARRSTAPRQPGSTLPILYAEYGVETQIPAAKASLYTGTEPATIKPVAEATQASLLPAGDRDVVLPAERDRPPDLPRVRRDRARPLPVGPLLRGRDAEVEPARRPRRRARRHAAA